MENNYKKILISIFVFFIILLLSVSIIIANNSTDKINFELDKEKIYYEIKYFDTEIIYMINLLNNMDDNTNYYIDWKALKNYTKNMYSYWNSVILDLNYLNLDKNHLTEFGRTIDELIVSIKNNEKENTINNLLRLYEKLIIYSESLEYMCYDEVLVTKYNLLVAYCIAEKENWTLTHEYILKSSESMSNIVNSVEFYEYNQYNINQAYIAIKEMENLINIKNLDVFYMKYKIAIDRLENLTF